VNFLRRLALKGGGGLDNSSRLDVVEIARVPDMLPSLFPLVRVLRMSKRSICCIQQEIYSCWVRGQMELILNNNESDFNSALLNVFHHVYRNVEYFDIELCV